MGWAKALWTVNKAAARAGARAGARADSAMQGYSMNRGVRRGVLAPGDPPPGAGAAGSYYDYRGVADIWKVPQEYRDAPFPLGRLLHPSKGLREPIGLFPEFVDHHVTIVGPAGAGKTTSVIVPWLLGGLYAGYTVVTVDVKGDLLERVRAELDPASPHLQSIAAIDYTRPNESLKWNWIDELDSPEAIDGAVQALLGKDPPPNTDPFHFYSDSEILRGLLELASTHPDRKGLTTRNLLTLLKNQPNLTRLAATHPESAARLGDLGRLYPDEYAKKVAAVAARLGALTNSSLESITNDSQIKTSEILQRPMLVSVVAPLQDGLMAKSLSSLFISQLLHHAFRRFSSQDGYPLLLIIDEAAQLADRIDLPNVLAVARSAGVAIVLAVQDVAQFKNENDRSVVVSNSGVVVCFAGVSPTTAELMSKRLGEHPVQTASVSRGPTGDGFRNATTTSLSTHMAPVLAAREIMAPPFGGRIATVHAREMNSQPFLVDMNRYG